MQNLFSAMDAWRRMYPGGHVGVLAMSGTSNPDRSDVLDARKLGIEASLRFQFAGMSRTDLREHPILKAYNEYYKRFGKTYHVQGQLESILKGKAIPTSGALVEAMFMAELESLLLTAGHDLDFIQPPMFVDVAKGTESYTLLNGKNQQPKPGDMMILDREGIISSIVHGPDQRTRIRPETTRVVFTVYGTEGIPPDAIEAHLHSIERNIQVVAPTGSVELLEVHPTGT